MHIFAAFSQIYPKSYETGKHMYSQMYYYTGPWRALGWEQREEYGIKVMATMTDNIHSQLMVFVDTTGFDEEGGVEIWFDCGYHSVRLSMLYSPIARFMGPTWGLPGADRTQVGPVWATWTLLWGVLLQMTGLRCYRNHQYCCCRHYCYRQHWYHLIIIKPIIIIVFVIVVVIVITIIIIILTFLLLLWCFLFAAVAFFLVYKTGIIWSCRCNSNEGYRWQYISSAGAQSSVTVTWQVW